LRDVLDAVEVYVRPAAAIIEFQALLAASLERQREQGLVANSFPLFHCNVVRKKLDPVDVGFRLQLDVGIRFLLDHHGRQNPNSKVSGFVDFIPDRIVTVHKREAQLAGPSLAGCNTREVCPLIQGFLNQLRTLDVAHECTARILGPSHQ